MLCTIDRHGLTHHSYVIYFVRTAAFKTFHTAMKGIYSVIRMVIRIYSVIRMIGFRPSIRGTFRPREFIFRGLGVGRPLFFVINFSRFQDIPGIVKKATVPDWEMSVSFNPLRAAQLFLEKLRVGWKGRPTPTEGAIAIRNGISNQLCI